MIKGRFILLILVLFWFKSSGQQTFFTFFPNPLNAFLLDLFEDKYGNYLAVGEQKVFNQFETTRGTLWRITPQGDTLSKYFAGADTTTGFAHILHSDRYYCTIIGGMSIPNKQNSSFTMILHLDSSLNVVEKKFILPESTTGASTEVLLKINDSYYCFGSTVELKGSPRHSIMKLNKDFNIIGFQTYSLNSIGSFAGSFTEAIESPDSSQLWAFGDNLTPGDQATCDMVVFDTLLNLIEIKPFPFGEYPHWSQFMNVQSTKWITDSTFLVGGSFWHQNYPAPSQIDIGLCKFDSSMVYRPVAIFGATDTIEDSAYFGTFDFNMPDSIFVTGTKRTGTGFFPRNPSWIHLEMVNNDLQSCFQRYYGGDAYYWVHKIIATNDGGALVAGNRYDYLTQGYERDVFFLKVNNEGLITSSANETYCPYLPFSVYPNPGGNFPIIHLATKNALLKVYSISGRLLKTMHLKEGANQADFSSLPSGIYILSSANQNGEVFSTKWIKN